MTRPKQQQAQTNTDPEVMLPPQGAPPAQNNAVMLAQHHTPPELLQLAIIKKSDITVIERMAALAERWQEATIKREQRIAFINALVDAKAEMPIIPKTRHVKFKSNKPGAADTDYWHEDLADVVDTAQPVLAKHGLSFRWKTEQPAKGEVKVTCILEHRGGHAETNSIEAAVDQSGNKNHIQAIKSVTTYLERMTALASVGLAARGMDDDGRKGGKDEHVEVISEEQLVELRKLMKVANRDDVTICRWADGIEKLEQLPAALYEEAIRVLNRIIKTAKDESTLREASGGS
jgi:hypothetical protein